MSTGVPQRTIAELVGQSQSEVSEILKGRRVMGYDQRPPQVAQWIYEYLWLTPLPPPSGLWRRLAPPALVHRHP